MLSTFVLLAKKYKGYYNGVLTGYHKFKEGVEQETRAVIVEFFEPIVCLGSISAFAQAQRSSARGRVRCLPSKHSKPQTSNPKP